MVRPDRYVCQSWHVAAKVVIQPYLRKSRRNRIEEEQGEEEEEEESVAILAQGCFGSSGRSRGPCPNP